MALPLRDGNNSSAPTHAIKLFAAKYKFYLPTEEQLRAEIERQKELFRLQHENMGGGEE